MKSALVKKEAVALVAKDEPGDGEEGDCLLSKGFQIEAAFTVAEWCAKEGGDGQR